MIEIIAASGLVTVQDLGWKTGRAIGLPQGGAIDAPALMAANALAGAEPDAAGLEVGAGSVSVRFGVPARFAVTGAVTLIIDGTPAPSWVTHQVGSGSVVAIAAGASGRFGYLGVDGGIAIDPTLGSRSTYLPTEIGGLAGRRLQRNDRLPIGPAEQRATVGRSIDPSRFTPTGPIRLVAGPQAHLFADSTRRLLETAAFSVSATSDRMGTRLLGPALAPLEPAAFPSEAACPGAIQIPDDGQAIAILADGPTVGGYPKIGVIASADLARFGQLGPNRTVRFEWISIAEAQRIRSEWRAELESAINEVVRPVPS